jgi:peptidoglycan/xylan/chitin deacetylase (PgdA/CDA1 family)
MAPTRDLGHAVLLSIDNLGEVADLQRDASPSVTPPGGHPSVTVALPALLRTLKALDLPATFFVEGLNAELYPDAVSAIAAAGHEVGLHAWCHEPWSELSPAEEDELLERGLTAFRGLGLEVEGFRPPGGDMGPRTPAALAAHGLHWGSPLGTRAARVDGVALLPFRWPSVDAYYRLESFADVRRGLGDAPEPVSARAAADALLAALERPAEGPLVLILHPFLMVAPDDWAQAERVLRRLADMAAAGGRWVATGRELAALVLA